MASTVFEEGKMKVKEEEREAKGSSPPKPVLVMYPEKEGDYPLVLFIHGYCLQNTYYTDVLKHISSHGYIIVAPQLYTIALPCAYKEIESAANVANWLPAGLGPTGNILPPTVRANFTKLAAAGHSRGGKAAFSLLLGLANISDVKFSTLIGVDPVAGCCCVQIPPPVLTHKPNSFTNIKVPVMVIGTGLGDQMKNIISPPCAPEGANYKDFFNESCAPCCCFVAEDYGHMDMLDDGIPDIIGKVAVCVCKTVRAVRVRKSP